MKLTINIEFDQNDTPEKVAQVLVALAEVGLGVDSTATKTNTDEPRKGVQKRATAVEEPKVETPKEKPSKPAKEKAPVVEATIEEVRKIAASKKRAGHTAELKEILNEFNASKLSDLQEEDYAAVIEKMQAL